MLTDAELGIASAAFPTVRAVAPEFLADCAERRRSAGCYLTSANRLVNALGAYDVRNWRDGIAATHPSLANWVRFGLLCPHVRRLSVSASWQGNAARVLGAGCHARA